MGSTRIVQNEITLVRKLLSHLIHVLESYSKELSFNTSTDDPTSVIIDEDSQRLRDEDVQQIMLKFNERLRENEIDATDTRLFFQLSSIPQTITIRTKFYEQNPN